MADLCFGKNVPPEKIKIRGITEVTAADAELASRMGYSVKLLGRAKRVENRLAVWVSPHLIGGDKLLSNISGVMNGISVRGNAVGECLFYGAGAGKLPTASAVVADLIDTVRRTADGKGPTWTEGAPDLLVDTDTLPSRWYIRAGADTGALEAVFGAGAVSGDGESAVISAEMPRSELEDMCQGLDVRAVFPVL